MQTAPFNPDRFSAVVDHYQAARLRYAPDLIAWLARACRTEGRTVLDLGCGPGFIANAIAPLAGDVLGLDPSAAMIAAAQAEAAPNARFAVGSSQDLSAVSAPLQLVTMGRAFHWMDRVQTARDLDGLIAPGGAIALLSDRPMQTPMNRWYHAANAVTRDFAVMDDFGSHQKSDDWVPHEEVLRGTAFCDLRALTVYQEHEWTYTDFLRYGLSRSRTTEALLGDALPAMEAALKDALAPFGPGPWRSLHQHIALIARRPDEGRDA